MGFFFVKTKLLRLALRNEGGVGHLPLKMGNSNFQFSPFGRFPEGRQFLTSKLQTPSLQLYENRNVTFRRSGQQCGALALD